MLRNHTKKLHITKANVRKLNLVSRIEYSQTDIFSWVIPLCFSAPSTMPRNIQARAVLLRDGGNEIPLTEVSN